MFWLLCLLAVKLVKKPRRVTSQGLALLELILLLPSIRDDIYIFIYIFTIQHTWLDNLYLLLF